MSDFGPRGHKPIDPIDQAIETALTPDSFISCKATPSFEVIRGRTEGSWKRTGQGH